ncbi:DUF7638 domain-containing protein [Capnocytophaga catalasegens]|uniref:Uncharacterized protein n=1 Tax=Capnocytophaga catalasegens TaxID=1004260 RepID=A0AAV5B100_9FLAO|nr:hypothetical protein [Capnocytophaga catalasegens]GIZ14393.1 hypothetical protein RCZ03_03940 [Capnocytophaga catalasegens]GJM51513.1 hypothetical protein RCZ15_24860 [Capnocytophaga catalasegens]GJM53417.1 hypothetical protein RCZ16_17340 [Capnocytophaga catalasegens]
MTFKSSNKVYKTQEIQGVSIPAIIQNGGYHFVDLDIYENGRVYCWNFHDFEIFKDEIKQEWVVLNIPDRENISIFNLGSWKIKNSNWIFNKKSFIDYVESLIREMNPQWKNIYTYVERKIGEVTIGENGEGTIYKEKYPDNPFDTKKIDGKKINLFYKENGTYHLVKVLAFADRTLQITRLETPFEVNFEEFKKLVAEKKIITNPPKNTIINIYGLGSFTIDDKSWSNDIEDILGELEETFRKLNNEPTYFDLCKKAFEEFKNNPTLENKNLLQEAYERVPEHQQMYLGDMDTRDIEIRMIIYGEEEIENWSHYQIAKKLGDELPNIEIPKIKDKNEE